MSDSQDSAPTGTKRCSRCQESKRHDEFPPRKSSRDGLAGWCRLCSRAYHAAKGKEWRAKNRERMNASQRARYAANAEKAREYHQQWRNKNREEINQRAAIYYRESGGREAAKKRREENPEPSRAACRRWYQRNREKVLTDFHRRRATEKAGYVTPGFLEWLVDQPCAYCGAEDRIEVDHVVPIARGGDHDEMNLVPACRSCNASKGKKLMSEWKGSAHG